MKHQAAKVVSKNLQRANGLMARGRPDQALQVFEQARRTAPGVFEVHFGLARARQALGDASGAVDAFGTALDHAPAGDPRVLLALGQLARDLKAAEQAVGFFRAAALATPGSADAQTGLAHALRDLGRQEDAVELLQSALRLSPEQSALWTALGAVMADLEDHANAETFLREGLRLDPKNGAAAGNLAELLFAMGRADDAAETYELAMRLRPDDAALRFNHALFALGTGDLEIGWRDYEARLDRSYPGFIRRDLKQKRWDGREMPSGRLLVLAEQGVGDELHFLHCIRDTAERVQDLWWECDPRLLDLCTRSFPGVTFVPWQGSDRPGFHRGYDWLSDAPRFDAVIEAGSLQTLFRRDLDAFPASPALLGPQAMPRPADGRLRVGISWTSIHRNRLRDRGYVPLEHWGPLFALPGVEWVNLQYGEVTEEIAAAEQQFGVRISQVAGLDLKDDFDGTASLIATCDLVIAPTNTVRQLAASTGVPSLVFSRLPYEFALGQAVNPFFANMQDFVRLPDLDWTRCVQDVARHVRGLADSHPAA
ncbi:MAG: tetratricopeptide repeat protein [Minwuia sp.]|nr:tetratricopeptide repeat protein [Minwuia sp.]